MCLVGSTLVHSSLLPPCSDWTENTCSFSTEPVNDVSWGSFACGCTRHVSNLLAMLPSPYVPWRSWLWRKWYPLLFTSFNSSWFDVSLRQIYINFLYIYFTLWIYKCISHYYDHGIYKLIFHSVNHYGNRTSRCYTKLFQYPSTAGTKRWKKRRKYVMIKSISS